MEYQKIIDLLDDTTNQPSKFRTTIWVEINDEWWGEYDNSSIKFETSVISSNSCDYSDVYILASRTITITGGGDHDAAKRKDERNKGLMFKNCALFTNCINNINNTQMDNAEYIDVVMSMYNLIQCSYDYSKNIRQFMAIF